MSNTPVTAKITDLSHDGRGIAHLDGKTLFIDGALPTEQVKFTYTRKRSKFDEGKAVEIIEAANNRITPQCPHFGICGGCSLQHMRHQAQLELKQRVLLEQLQHFGNLQPAEVLPPIIGPIWGYRRKARLGVKYVVKKSKVLVGFREKNGRFLADLQGCEILHPAIGKNINALSQLIASLENYRQIPQLEVAVGDEVTAIIVRHLQPLSTEDLAKLTAFAQQYKLHIYLQPKGPDTIHPLYPASAQPLSYKLAIYSRCNTALDSAVKPRNDGKELDIELLFQPTDFTQINAEINQQMVTRAIELLDPQPDENLLDLFCGLGNFTLPLAKLCHNITGIEGSSEMIKRAWQNAKHNSINNSQFYCANLAEDVTAQLWSKQLYSKILLDPPRTGALELIELLAKLKAEKIVYISCNPATLARDAGELAKRGYRLTKAGIMDMFPHTKHVEAIAEFTL